ncbi:MAG: ABC transporter permease [Anaerolineales bacterium]|nr:ABC transporter permease [Anaerolineales bacterium]
MFRRLLILPLAMILANFLGLAYSHLAHYFHEVQNPFGSAVVNPTPIWSVYLNYIHGISQLDFGSMPLSGGKTVPVIEVITDSTLASIGLLALAYILSLVLGLAIGFSATRNEPAEVKGWLAPISAAGQAMPGFYVGTLFILGGIIVIGHSGADSEFWLPLQGFGWDSHLVLPTLALLARPTVQIAQLTANLLSDELGKQYVVAARSHGLTWRMARWKHALRNVLAPVILNMAASFRTMVCELILVEYLFGWQGLGRLLALTLIPPSTATVSGLANVNNTFLHPELTAALMAIFTLLFLVADGIASTAARLVDHRLQSTGEERHFG